MKTLGVIGGLGPMATVYFLELLTKMEQAESDQNHFPIVMESIPETLDRTAYILNQRNPNPLPFLIEAGKHLKEIEAEYLAIPCVTAHYFHEQCDAFIVPGTTVARHEITLEKSATTTVADKKLTHCT